MPTDRLLTRPEVEDRVRLTRSSIYRNMRKGLFPLPIRIGPKAVRWRESEIEQWLASQPRAAGDGTGT